MYLLSHVHNLHLVTIYSILLNIVISLETVWIYFWRPQRFLSELVYHTLVTGHSTRSWCNNGWLAIWRAFVGIVVIRIVAFVSVIWSRIHIISIGAIRSPRKPWRWATVSHRNASMVHIGLRVSSGLRSVVRLRLIRLLNMVRVNIGMLENAVLLSSYLWRSLWVVRLVILLILA